MSDARVLTAAGADQHYVGNVDARFFLHNAALDVLRRVRTCVALDHAYMLDHYAILARIDRQYPAAFAAVASRHHFYGVTLAHANNAAFRTLMPVADCHDLPDLRS